MSYIANILVVHRKMKKPIYVDFQSVIWLVLDSCSINTKVLEIDVRNFILACDRCQKVNPVKHIYVAELPSAPVPVAVMAQIGVHITNLTRRTEDGYCCVVVAMDHFSKWPEARALRPI